MRSPANVRVAARKPDLHNVLLLDRLDLGPAEPGRSSFRFAVRVEPTPSGHFKPRAALIQSQPWRTVSTLGLWRRWGSITGERPPYDLTVSQSP
jgi:hypothetical protein